MRISLAHDHGFFRKPKFQIFYHIQSTTYQHLNSPAIVVYLEAFSFKLNIFSQSQRNQGDRETKINDDMLLKTIHVE